MRTLITLCSLLAAIALGWHYNTLSNAKKDEDIQLQAALSENSKIADLKRELSETRVALDAANAQLIQLSAKPVPTPKPNWVEERNKNWKSNLGTPASGNRRVMNTTPYIYPVPPPPPPPTPPALRLP